MFDAARKFFAQPICHALSLFVFGISVAFVCFAAGLSPFWGSRVVLAAYFIDLLLGFVGLSVSTYFFYLPLCRALKVDPDEHITVKITLTKGEPEPPCDYYEQHGYQPVGSQGSKTPLNEQHGYVPEAKPKEQKPKIRIP
jgi:hypothetical protein